MQMYLEFKDDTSNKFWSLVLEGSSFTVTFGKIGTAGQSQQKAFATPEAAQKEAEKLAAGKRKKGYVDAPLPANFAAPAAKPAPPPIAPAPLPMVDGPAPGPAPLADDGKPKPWHDEEDEAEFDLRAMAQADRAELPQVEESAAEGERNTLQQHRQAFEDACAAGDLAAAQAAWQALAPQLPDPKKQAALLTATLDAILCCECATADMPKVVCWLLQQGAAIPKKYVDNDMDDERALRRESMREYFYIAYGKNQTPARGEEIVNTYIGRIVAGMLDGMEEQIAAFRAFVPNDDDRSYRGFGRMFDREDRARLFGVKNIESFHSTEMPALFWPYFYEEYQKNPVPTRLREIFNDYMDSAFPVAARVLAQKIREYADYVRAGKEVEDSDFELTSTGGKIDKTYSSLEIGVFNEYWFFIYLNGSARNNVFDVKVPEVAGLTREFFPRYAHLLAKEMEKLAAEGVFEGLFEWGGFVAKLDDSPQLLMTHADKDAAERFEEALRQLEASTSWAQDTPLCLAAFPLVLHGVFAPPDEERAYALLLRFLYGCTNAATEDVIMNKLHRWEDSYPRVLHELAVFYAENLNPDKAKSYAQEALDAGYAPAAELLTRLGREAVVRRRLAGGGAQPPQGFNLAEAKKRWRGTSFDKAFTEADLYRKTENIAARARPNGNIYIRFLVEGEAGYGEALDFVNNLLEKGYSHLSGGWSDGFALRVRFLHKPQYLSQLATAKVLDGVSYPTTDAHAFFARAAQYPALRQKVKDYAERALVQYDWYLDLPDEGNTVPGTFAVAALAFCGKEYLPLVSLYAAAVDDEHSYLHPLLVPALVKHYGQDVDLAPAIFSIALVANRDEPFKLPKDYIWSAAFMARLLAHGGSDENDASGLEYFGRACEHIYGDNLKGNLKKLRELAQTSADAQVYADFYNTYLAACQIWDEDEVEKFKPITAALPATGEELQQQDAVITLEEAKKRGYEILEVFDDKTMIMFIPTGTQSPKTLAHGKKQIGDIGRENSKDKRDRRCYVLIQSGYSCFKFGKWVVNTKDLACECGILLHGGKKEKPMVLYGELDILQLGIACTKRWPKTLVDAETLRRQYLLAESAPRLTGPEWEEAEAFFEEEENGGVFYSEWHHAMAQRALVKITPKQGALTYLFSRLMLAYLAERRGDAAQLGALAEELMALQPNWADYWQQKRDAAQAI